MISAKRICAVCLSLVLCLILVSCTGSNLSWSITPTSVTQPTPTDEPVPADQPLQAVEAIQPVLADKTVTASSDCALSAFTVSFSSSRAVVLSALYAVAERLSVQASSDPPSVDPVQNIYDLDPDTLASELSEYLCLPDTLPAQLSESCAALSGELACLLGRETAVVYHSGILTAEIPLPSSLWSLSCEPQQLLLENSSLVVLLALTDQKDDIRTAMLFYDLSVPSAPVFIGLSAIDGQLIRAHIGRDRLTIITDFEPDSGSLRLPSRYDEANVYPLPVRQVLMPSGPELARFTVVSDYSTQSGLCEGWFAAAGALPEAMLLSEDLLIISWPISYEASDTWTESVYNVTETTHQTHCGIALMQYGSAGWQLLSSCRIRGLPDLIGVNRSGVICLGVNLNTTVNTVYRDPLYGWSNSSAPTDSAVSSLYMLDDSLTCLGELVLANDAAEFLGLYDSTLYFVTQKDGILRAASTSDPGQPLSAPLAEVQNFRDLTVLAEGVAIALCPARSGSGLELVLLNVSNPTHITRKYMSMSFSDRARLISGRGISQGYPLLAVQDDTLVCLFRCSVYFGPEPVQSFRLCKDSWYLASGSNRFCLLSRIGYVLLDADLQPQSCRSQVNRIN